MGAASRPRSTVIVICQRAIVEGGKLGLSVKFIRYDEEPFKAVKHFKLAHTAIRIEF